MQDQKQDSNSADTFAEAMDELTGSRESDNDERTNDAETREETEE